MSAPVGGVDVLAVMDAEIASLPVMAEMAEMATAGGIACDAADAIARLSEARAAVADLVEVSRMGAEALETAAKLIDHDFAILLRDRANFIRAAIAKVASTGASE